MEIATAKRNGIARRALASCIAAAIFAALALPCHAQPTGEKPQTVWYGWQNLSVIGGSLAVAVAGSSADRPEAAIPIGLAGFYLGPPIVHWSHGNSTEGIASLGLGVGGGLLAGFVGAALNPGHDCSSQSDTDVPTFCVNAAPLVGFAYGAAAAGLVYVVVDVAALAWEEVPAASSEKTTDASSFRLAPKIWLAQNQTTFGVSGEF
jgi:hypothetical protein